MCEGQKARQEEVQAVSEALAILSSDDAHDTFTSTFNFLQTEEQGKRDQAAKVLFTAAKKFGNPKLSAIATSMRLDAFTKVKAAIDEMISALLKEKEDEIKHKVGEGRRKHGIGQMSSELSVYFSSCPQRR